MTRRRSILIFAIVIVVISAIAYAAYGPVRDYDDRHDLFVGCHSDKLGVIADAYTSAMAGRADKLPGRAAVVDSLDAASRGQFLTCVGSGQPFVWTDQAETLDPNGRRIPLVWCPDGAHGRHVGVVLLDNGQVTHVMLTRPELAELLRRPGR